MTSVRGDLLLHPVAALALLTLALNDHLLKGWAPGVLTGKLSGVAGLIVVPLLLVALWERRPGGSPTTSGAVLVTSAVVAVVYVLVELVPGADAAYEAVWGALRWPIDAAASLLDGRSLPGYRPAAHWQDTTDLLCLPAAAVAAWVGLRLRTPRGRSRPARTRRSGASWPGTPAVRAGSAAG